MNDMSDDSTAALRAELEACRSEISRLRLMLDVQATIDLSTGLYNAQGMLEPIQVAMDRLARTEEPFAVVVIDLPRVAERTGEIRDAAMRHAGAIVSATVRSLDRVGRIGDASLMVVLPQTGAAGIQVVLERIDRSLGIIPLDHEGDSIVLESVFTVLLSPEQPMQPEILLDLIADAREGATLGVPAIVRAEPQSSP
jgi:diguanylate cyclase (GGDEF)-like protein